VRSRSIAALLGLLVVISVAVVSASPAAVGTDTSALRSAVTVDGVMAHAEEFQAIADANGGTRVATSPGYDASAAYVADKLRGAGYSVTIQPFEFPFFEETGTHEFERLSPTPRDYVLGTDFDVMEYSGAGDVTGEIVPTNDVVIPPGATASTSNSGCESGDFPAETTGRVALIQRGTCDFVVKARNAQAAGATAAIIFNEGQPGRTDLISGTLGSPDVTIPVLDTTFAVGEELYNLDRASGASVHILTQTISETRTTTNVIADTPTGRTDRVVVVGGHLDSVAEGPGINDNGSGTATILEVALQMSALGIEPRNQVRFAFWGAEESGLWGSERYVQGLTRQQRNKIMLNLNFDMVGSPNFVRFVYDGDGSAFGSDGPSGSARIESVFNDYFASQGLATEPTEFDGRSDYDAFINAGIPAGGLFTGAEGIKTAEQAAVYGGTAGVAYDPCYHQACDTIDNVNETAIDQMSDAVAHATLLFAMTSSSPNGTDKASNRAKVNSEFKGSHLKR
jgi:Zn-dependent M28 family amino/carboxypeptidase